MFCATSGDQICTRQPSIFLTVSLVNNSLNLRNELNLLHSSLYLFLWLFQNLKKKKSYISSLASARQAQMLDSLQEQPVIMWVTKMWFRTLGSVLVHQLRELHRSSSLPSCVNLKLKSSDKFFPPMNGLFPSTRVKLLSLFNWKTEKSVIEKHERQWKKSHRAQPVVKPPLARGYIS